jgi:hypothetical protein
MSNNSYKTSRKKGFSDWDSLELKAYLRAGVAGASPKHACLPV